MAEIIENKECPESRAPEEFNGKNGFERFVKDQDIPLIFTLAGCAISGPERAASFLIGSSFVWGLSYLLSKKFKKAAVSGALCLLGLGTVVGFRLTDKNDQRFDLAVGEAVSGAMSAHDIGFSKYDKRDCLDQWCIKSPRKMMASIKRENGEMKAEMLWTDFPYAGDYAIQPVKDDMVELKPIDSGNPLDNRRSIFIPVPPSKKTVSP